MRPIEERLNEIVKAAVQEVVEAAKAIIEEAKKKQAVKIINS